MGLTELWKNSPEQLRDKGVKQIISFAGEGKLRDGSIASKEFREFLSQVPFDLIKQYASECLLEKFEDNGLALQDIVNQVGSRLSFKIKEGRYRGSKGEIGFDGLWRSSQGNSIVVEVKTTDAYRIDLNTITDYRRNLIKSGLIEEDRSSILIVVGREDTGDLEAQVRGSKHAWDVRLISVEALLNLLYLKGDVEDPGIAQKICDILIPREYTKVDDIINLVFSTTREVLQEEKPSDDDSLIKTRFKPVHFNEACIFRIEKYLKQKLLKKSRVVYISLEGSTALVCAVSKEYDSESKPGYWFSFHPHQEIILNQYESSYVSFGCGSEKKILLIPWMEFKKWLPCLHQTIKEDRAYWHVIINTDDKSIFLYTKKEYDNVDLTKYLIP